MFFFFYKMFNQIFYYYWLFSFCFLLSNSIFVILVLRFFCCYIFFYSYGLCSIARGTSSPQWLCLCFRGWYFVKKEWYQCNQLYPWSTSSFFLVSFICKRKLLLPYYQTIVVWQFTLDSLSFICRTLQMIYSCYLMHLRITSSAC